MLDKLSQYYKQCCANYSDLQPEKFNFNQPPRISFPFHLKIDRFAEQKQLKYPRRRQSSPPICKNKLIFDTSNKATGNDKGNDRKKKKKKPIDNGYCKTIGIWQGKRSLARVKKRMKAIVGWVFALIHYRPWPRRVPLSVISSKLLFAVGLKRQSTWLTGRRGARCRQRRPVFRSCTILPLCSPSSCPHPLLN